MEADGLGRGCKGRPGMVSYGRRLGQSANAHAPAPACLDTNIRRSAIWEKFAQGVERLLLCGQPALCFESETWEWKCVKRGRSVQ